MTNRFACAMVATIGITGCIAPKAQDESGQSIQAGAADKGDPAVGFVWFTMQGFCTGTLISPTVVLTAGHCVQDEIEGFYTGDGVASTDIVIPPGMVKHAVSDMVAHPSYLPGACPNPTLDIGLIRLTDPVTDIAPMGYTKSAAPALKTECQAVGFGTHTNAKGQDEYGEKRSGTETVTSVITDAIEVSFTTALADHGDSGGPLVCDSVVAGTTSCHVDGDWPSHKTEYYARVDTAATWIEGYVKKWAPANDDGGTSKDGGAKTDAGTAKDGGIIESDGGTP
jgi:secreted trypsin-like serine protease